jgi:uncharacterized protein (DUF983 family)
MESKSYLTALIEGRCPKCRTGKIFAHPASSLTKFNKMNETCPHCGVRLEPEPGFYQGAMYVGYGFTIAFMIIVSVLLYIFLDDPSEWIYIGVVVAGMLLLVPLNYRFSRIVFLYLFGGLRYDPRLSK